MKLPAHLIPTFCAATGNTLVLDLIQHQTEELLEGRGRSRREFEETGPYEVLKELHDASTSCMNAMVDGTLSSAEVRTIWRELRQAIETLLDYEESQNPTIDFQREKSIRDADSKRGG